MESISSSLGLLRSSPGLRLLIKTIRHDTKKDLGLFYDKFLNHFIVHHVGISLDQMYYAFIEKEEVYRLLGNDVVTEVCIENCQKKEKLFIYNLY